MMCFPGPALVNLPKSCNISAPTAADCPDRADIQRDVDDYMLISAAVAVALFLLFCLYFPAKPPLPPAPSSAIQRTEFWTGARQIFRNRSALLICFAYSMGVTLISLYHLSSYSCVQGVMGSWLSVMVNNFGPLNVTDKQIGLIGLFAVFGQCALVTATGLLIDRSDTSCFYSHPEADIIKLILMQTQAQDEDHLGSSDLPGHRGLCVANLDMYKSGALQFR